MRGRRIDVSPPIRPTELTPSEGDAFAVPLPAPGRWALAVVSRTSARWPHLVLAHYFSHRPALRPTMDQLTPLTAADAMLICRTSDLALRDRSWPMIGRRPTWTRRDWPMPRFAIPPHRPGDCWQIELYRDDDPGHLMRTTPVVDPAEAKGLHNSAATGNQLITQRLTSLHEWTDCGLISTGHVA